MITDWPEVELGDVVTLQRGFDLPTRERKSGAVPVVSSSGITGTHEAAKVDAPGVVTGRYGTLGEVFFVDEPFWPLNTTLYVKDFHGNDPRFCFYFLQDQGLETRGGAAAVPGVNRNVLHRLRVRLPPIPVQRKIAAILSAYDNLIENDSQQIKILEEIAQRIYREWFVDLRYPGHEAGSLVDSELGPIPSDWKAASLSSVTRQSTATISPSRFPDEYFEHFSIPAYDDARSAVKEYGKAILSNKFLVKGECVLYSKLNPRISRVWWADPGSNVRAVASTELLVLHPVAGWGRALLYATLQDPTFASRVIGMAGGTSTSHQRARPGDLLALPAIDPSPGLRDDYESHAGPLFRLSDILRRRSGVAKRLRDVLLPCLVSGQIDVADLEIEIPEVLA